jgi:hypothetical protein
MKKPRKVSIQFLSSTFGTTTPLHMKNPSPKELALICPRTGLTGAYLVRGSNGELELWSNGTTKNQRFQNLSVDYLNQTLQYSITSTYRAVLTPVHDHALRMLYARLSQIDRLTPASSSIGTACLLNGTSLATRTFGGRSRFIYIPVKSCSG